MKYWILAVSLLLFGCGGDETVGEEVSDTLHEAQDAAEEVGEVLEGARQDLDEAIEAADDTRND